ncbi:hypothetical protein U9M48_043726 [Paspalum notatum var. saurae]|uniref:Uncharacterized protein n=1 Tax=Paspalum notatum var. saurae TaxID=547442 RepID=A0AAQ3XHM0_PASNO
MPAPSAGALTPRLDPHRPPPLLLRIRRGAASPPLTGADPSPGRLLHPSHSGRSECSLSLYVERASFADGPFARWLLLLSRSAACQSVAHFTLAQKQLSGL